MKSVIAVCAGASFGALLRWGLSSSFNALFPVLPPGTLIANLLGSYLIGIALAFFARYPELPAEWRLLIVTGFLGGLTTFSTFSAEVALLIRQERLFWAAAALTSHVAGAVSMTLLGLLSFELFKKIF